MKKTLLILVCLGVTVGCGNSSKNEEIERLKAELENKQSGANKMEWNGILDKIHAKLMRFRDENTDFGDTNEEANAEEKRHVRLLDDLTLDAKSLAADLKASGFPEHSQIDDIIEKYRSGMKSCVFYMRLANNDRQRAQQRGDFEAALNFKTEHDLTARKKAVEANTALERLKTLQN